MSAARRAANHETPLGALARGALAGAAGTAAMTALQQALPSGSDDDEDSNGWANAPAPAQVAKRILEGVFHREVSEEQIPLLTNVAHWAYGTAWGSAYGALQGTLRTRPFPLGIGFGAGVWAASYVALVPMGIYKPPWRYRPSELATDLSYHFVYGAGTALVYDALDL
jgi:hypothetical protein